MLKILHADLIIFSLATRFSHTTQRWFGITSYRLAQQCCILFALGCFIRDIDYFFPRFMDEETGAIIMYCSFILTVVYIWQAERCADADRQFAADPTVVPYFVSKFIGIKEFALRVMFIPLAFIALSSAIYRAWKAPTTWQAALIALDRSGVLWLCLFLYFITVVPLPPGQSKLRQFLGFWRTLPRPVLLEE